MAISAEMIIGFRTNVTTRVEGLETFRIEVHSKVISELEYEIGFRHIQGRNPTDATVETADILDPIFDSNFDARFGDRRDPNNSLDHLETTIVLEKGRLVPSGLLFTTIYPDVRLELDECYTISIFIIDTVTGCGRLNYDCNENEDNPEDFFCEHTVCIWDDDG